MIYNIKTKKRKKGLRKRLILVSDLQIEFSRHSRVFPVGKSYRNIKGIHFKNSKLSKRSLDSRCNRTK